MIGPIDAPVAPPTDHQRLLRERAALAVRWLERSIQTWDGAGSAAFASRLARPPRGWDHPYPETTGYIVPTLITYAGRTGEARWASLAVSQADWLLGLQHPDGWFPGGTHRPGGAATPSVFNTGQIVLGLVAAADHTGDSRYLDAAAAASSWLADGVDRRAGIWTANAYVDGFSPSYYTRVAWPMLEVWARRPDDALREAAEAVLDTVVGRQRPDGVVEMWGFKPGQPAFTHTIAYTIRGLLESARVLGGEGERFAAAAERSAAALQRRADLRGGLAGAYDDRLKGQHRYVCLTGNCQMAIVWLRLVERTGDHRGASTALRALERVLRSQRVRTLDPVVRGAIAGSSPRWGRYLTMRYPNWATKFFVDATMVADDYLDRMLREGPCESP